MFLFYIGHVLADPHDAQKAAIVSRVRHLEAEGQINRAVTFLLWAELVEEAVVCLLDNNRFRLVDYYESAEPKSIGEFALHIFLGREAVTISILYQLDVDKCLLGWSKQLAIDGHFEAAARW